LTIIHFSVDLKRNVSKVKNFGRVGTIISVQPELAIVFDNANYNTFKGNNTEMLKYLALLVHSVNNRYANIANPKIQFTVSGLLAISVRNFSIPWEYHLRFRENVFLVSSCSTIHHKQCNSCR